MYENTSTYTWWDIEDGVGPLATQATSRWETLGLPKDAIGSPVVLRVWVTPEDKIVYTITLFRDAVDLYTAEGEIKIPEVPSWAAARDVIFESSADLIGESIASKLVEGLLPWLHRQ